MERRLNKKVETYITTFKDSIREKATQLGLSNDVKTTQLLQYIYDHDRLSFNKEDFQLIQPRLRFGLRIYKELFIILINLTMSMIQQTLLKTRLIQRLLQSMLKMVIILVFLSLIFKGFKL